MIQTIKNLSVPAAVLMLICAASCHKGDSSSMNGEENKGAVIEATAGEGPGEIVISMEQFESSGMKIGDPAPTMFSQIIKANGYIGASPGGIAQISSMIPGRVKDINLTIGDYVKKGQLLFTMEGTEIILLQQQYAEGYNQLVALKANYDRQKALTEEGITSQKEFINTESSYRSLLAKVGGLKAQLRMINIDPSGVEKGLINPVATIRSPINGHVTSMELVLGQYIEPQTMVMELINRDQLRLNLYVFERDLKNLVVGQEVIFYDSDDITQLFGAILSHIGKSIDYDTKTVRCVAEIKVSDRNMFVNGMFVETEIITCKRETLAIPFEALMKEEDKYYVFIRVEEKEGNLILRKTPVQIGAVTKEYAEVLDEGLRDVLLEGAFYLSSGE